MSSFLIVVALFLYIRLMLGIILFISSIGKFLHPYTFQRDIQSYNVIPSSIDTALHLSRIVSIGIPTLECAAGLGLVSGLMPEIAITLAIGLFALFSIAIFINLVKGRSDQSCHCGGILGDQRISWWLVARNVGFILACIFLLLYAPADIFTLNTLYSPSHQNIALWITIGVPTICVTLGTLLVISLVKVAISAFRFQQ